MAHILFTILTFACSFWYQVRFCFQILQKNVPNYKHATMPMHQILKVDQSNILSFDRPRELSHFAIHGESPLLTRKLSTEFRGQFSHFNYASEFGLLFCLHIMYQGKINGFIFCSIITSMSSWGKVFTLAKNATICL